MAVYSNILVVQACCLTIHSFPKTDLLKKFKYQAASDSFRTRYTVATPQPTALAICSLVKPLADKSLISLCFAVLAFFPVGT
jgi:hypothetical protein